MITKKIKKINIYLFVFLIFTTNTHFFNDLYNIFYRNYEERMIRTYGYCGGISYGFIKKIKSKFLQFENKVIIINNYTFASSLGLFPDLLIDKEKNNIILLNFSDLNKKKLIKFSINIDDYKLIYNEDKCYFLKKK
jgi:hypothetical protein